jgi:RNA polymerase sigma factor
MIPEVIDKSIDLNSRAIAAKASEYEMEKLISDFKPFLYSRASKYSQSGDRFRREELFSTAMLAFYEAIKAYDVDKGHFFPFASNVVRNNLIDHIRKIYRQEGKTVSLEVQDSDISPDRSAAVEEVSIRQFHDNRRRDYIVDEIEQFKAELSEWGMTMESLAQQSPKHKKVAQTYKQVIAQILESPDILQTIQLKRYFPIKAISNITGLPQKKLERARTFILASLIIKMGDYDYLSDYVSGGD